MLLPQVSLGSAVSQEEDFFLQVTLKAQCGLFLPSQQVQREGHEDEGNEDRDRGLEHKTKRTGILQHGKEEILSWSYSSLPRGFQEGWRGTFYMGI